MKNLNKINPEARVILSDNEMKEISGGYFIEDACPITPTGCSTAPCIKDGKTGRCMYVLGQGCKCVIFKHPDMEKYQ